MDSDLPLAVRAALDRVIKRQCENPTTPLSCSTSGADVQSFCMLVVECHKAMCADEGSALDGATLAKYCEIAGIKKALWEALAGDLDVGINVLDMERSGSVALGPVYSRPPWTAES